MGNQQPSREKRKVQRFWNPSYFIATVSDKTEEQIREYIQKQKEK